MIKKFLDDDFVLDTETAKRLYHEHAAKQPIFDFHSHLNPDDIESDRVFNDLGEIWLQGDHYKWRAMRANGVDEKYVTGDASGREKFEKWAETVPYTIRNPLYHWTHLELKAYFGIETLLNKNTAEAIFNKATTALNSKEYSVRNLLRKSNVKALCTTDDPVSDLLSHKSLATSGFEVKVFPTFRPDAAMSPENHIAYNSYLDMLSEKSGITISTYDQLVEALDSRHEYFHSAGCRLSDNGLETVYAQEHSKQEVEKFFSLVRGGTPLDQGQIQALRSAILLDCCRLNAKRGWAQQIHIGPLRNCNSTIFGSFGPDAGCDSIADTSFAKQLAAFLDTLHKEGRLCKTVIYNLNPKDNAVISTMIGNFQDGGIPGKMQFGSGWWFLDQKQGMEDQINSLSSQGLLGRFIGMLTDSRSFLSFPRHEYFRRILCNLIGTDVEKGLIPDDKQLLGSMVENICYKNARDYFNLPIE